MTVINQRIIDMLKSSRSHVCRTTCKAIGHLFEYIKDTRRPGPDHKNALVRISTARLVVCAVVIAGSTYVLHPNNSDYTRRRIVLNMGCIKPIP
ncbi:hypothetical protein YQE_01456, partial [Dendroctonus ponderosae]